MEVVRFWLDDWTCGETYPNEEPFISWMGDDLNLKFMDLNYIKDNKLCVKCGVVDMSVVFDVTAPKEWVDKNCPNIYKYPKFLGKAVWSKDQECIDYYVDGFGYKFLEYSEENIGIIHVNGEDELIQIDK